MDRESSWKTECPIVQTLERVGERWNILLLLELFRGAHRFDELQTSLAIAPNILSSRLTRLVDAGFVDLVEDSPFEVAAGGAEPPAGKPAAPVHPA